MSQFNLDFKILDVDFFKRFELPKYATSGSAGIDLRANLKQPNLTIAANQAIKVGTALAININNPGYAAVILPRSGMGSKGLVLGNLVGLIDSDYQGELIVSLWNRTDQDITIEDGERVAQLVIMPVVQANLIQVADFATKSERGESGFGSTGK